MFPTRGAALRHDLDRLARVGRRVVTLPLCWLDGVAAGAETLRAFLADPALPLRLRVVWGNERLAARPDVGEEQRRALRLYHADPSGDADLCAFLCACLDDPRYDRGADGRRPVLLHAPESGLEAVMARWRPLLPADTALRMVREWPDTA